MSYDLRGLGSIFAPKKGCCEGLGYIRSAELEGAADFFGLRKAEAFYLVYSITYFDAKEDSCSLGKFINVIQLNCYCNKYRSYC